LEPERLRDGRQVHVVQLRHRAHADAPIYTLTVKVDARDYALVEVVQQRGGRQNVRLTQFERNIIPAAEVSSDLFNALPEGLTVAGDQFVIPRSQATADRVWINLASLPPRGELPERRQLEVEVGYELRTAPKALLSVGVMIGNKFIELADVTAHGSNGVVRVDLGDLAGRFRHVLGSGEVKLAAYLYLSSGPQSLRVIARNVSEEYRYTLPTDSVPAVPSIPQGLTDPMPTSPFRLRVIG
jgi:hypothetical protein